MATIHPYIHYNGNAEDAFRFYQSVFGGDFVSLVRFKDMAFDGAPDWAEEAEKIMHIALPIGAHSMLMGSDTPASMGTHNLRENRSKIFVATESRAEADRLFEGLSVGGEVEMPIAESPWGTYFGMFRDRFGIEWMLEFDGK